MSTDYNQLIDFWELASAYARLAKHQRNAARTALRNELAMLFINGSPSSSSLAHLNTRVRELERAIEADAEAQLTCKGVRHALEAAPFVESGNVAEGDWDHADRRVIGFVPCRRC